MIDELKEEMKNVEQFCKENNILVFHGEIQKPVFAKFKWSNDFQTTKEYFLNALKLLQPCPLIIDILENKILDFLEFANPSEFEDDMFEDENDKKEYLSVIDFLKERHNQYVKCDLLFVNNNTLFSFQKECSWIDTFYTVFSSADDKYYSKDDDSLKDDLDSSDFEKLAKEIANEEDFRKAKSPYERAFQAELWLQKKNIKTKYFQKIFLACEQIFQKEIKPALEEELLQQIRIFKAMKLKKIEVRSRLGISERKLSDLWFKV
jgi:hypothetical protein